MVTVGLTGGIGSGKSYISKVFQNLNIPVFNSDNKAKSAYQDPVIRELVLDLLGPDSYIHGKSNTKYIASVAFNNSDTLSQLNSIVHPWLEKQFLTWTGGLTDYPYLIKEAAIIFETGIYQKLDYTICVTAPEQTRISRIISRDNSTETEIAKRIKHQWSDEKKTSLADFIIQNDGKQLVVPQILKIHQALINKQ